MAQHWTLEEINWSDFQQHLVCPEFLAIAKTASVVEHNGRHYADYLYRVFAHDPEFKEAVRLWALEEVQHGEALGRWAEMADPSFNFMEARQRFAEGYKLPLDIDRSVRGSCAGELIARCIVETGTSSFYTAVADRTEEPVLKQICRKIAADEFRHYKLFYDHLKAYQARENLSKTSRLKIVLGRFMESSDDELSYAHYVANNLLGPYDRKSAHKAYAELTFPLYTKPTVAKVVGMALKPAGFDPQGLLSRLFAGMLTYYFRFNTK